MKRKYVFLVIVLMALIVTAGAEEVFDQWNNYSTGTNITIRSTAWEGMTFQPSINGTLLAVYAPVFDSGTATTEPLVLYLYSANDTGFAQTEIINQSFDSAVVPKYFTVFSNTTSTYRWNVSSPPSLTAGLNYSFLFRSTNTTIYGYKYRATTTNNGYLQWNRSYSTSAGGTPFLVGLYDYPFYILMDNATTTPSLNCTDAGSDGINNNIILVSTSNLTSNCYTDGVDDNVEIQYAFDNTTSNKTVHLNAGTYYSSAYMWLNASNATIEGNGTATNLTVNASARQTNFPQENLTIGLYAALIVMNADNQTLKDILIHGGWDALNLSYPVGDYLGGGYNFINLVHALHNNFTIINNTFRNGINDGIKAALGVENTLIKNNTFYDIWHSAIDSNSYNSSIENNIITTSGHSYLATGIRIWDAYNTTYRNNTITHSGTYVIWYGFEIHSFQNKSLYGLVLENNTIFNNGHSSISFDSDGGTPKTTDKTKISGIVIKNNKIIRTPLNNYGLGNGIYIEGTSLFNNMTIINNVINGSNGDGIEFYNVAGNDNIIKNNIITNSSRYGINQNNSNPLTSTYNDIYNSTLGDYNNTIAGTGDISVDPLFVSSSDFHLKSVYNRWNGSAWVQDIVTSPALLAGDPTSDNSLSPWGGVIEMGAYGNTAEASQGEITYTPPVPVWVLNTTGLTWVNHTWQAGAGNITDSYNISQNGTWYNGTTDTFFNGTIAAGNWSNITIWAFNNSGGLSTISISNNSQVPVFASPSTTTSSVRDRYYEQSCSDSISLYTFFFDIFGIAISVCVVFASLNVLKGKGVNVDIKKAVDTMLLAISVIIIGLIVLYLIPLVSEAIIDC